jgi:hypothetical protein
MKPNYCVISFFGRFIILNIQKFNCRCKYIMVDVLYFPIHIIIYYNYDPQFFIIFSSLLKLCGTDLFSSQLKTG